MNFGYFHLCGVKGSEEVVIIFVFQPFLRKAIRNTDNDFSVL